MTPRSAATGIARIIVVASLIAGLAGAMRTRGTTDKTHPEPTKPLSYTWRMYWDTRAVE